MSELKRCPFCGGEAKLHKSIFIKYEATVICENCGARTLTHSSASYADVKMNAIKAWNTRKPMDRIVERLEEERKEITKWDSDKHYIYKEGADWMGEKAIEIVKEEQ